MTGALWWDRTRGAAQLEELLTRREQARDGRFLATSVKLMLDGVCETGTAAMSSPYLDGHGHSTGHRGRLFRYQRVTGGRDHGDRRPLAELVAHLV